MFTLLFSFARRRGAATAVTAAITLTLVSMTPAAAGPPHHGGHQGNKGQKTTVTVLGTSDLYGYIENWDYFKDGEYDDAGSNDVGLAKISTLVDSVRADRGKESTLLIDAGDTIQGTSLTDYFANTEPITETGEIHPMAAAMNEMDYDAAALGNHEFNYGLDMLRKFESQLDFPLLGANAVDAGSGKPAFTPYIIKNGEDQGKQSREGRYPGPHQPGGGHLGQKQR
ncbi:hypothetical protein [Arthrobacter sp. UYP6]|uniref:hypothetical protein n=1 Tax=Arthrobacter sp. UYP6 TaxID=1756378 RepID=UPI003398E422